MVTVDEALRKGHRTVTIPGFIIMLTLLVTFSYLSILKSISNFQMLAGLGISFIIPWLYWSFMITKWRLWAFKNVDNCADLKFKAIQEKLIWKDGSIFEKTEIRTKAEKEEWQAIIQKRTKNRM